ISGNTVRVVEKGLVSGVERIIAQSETGDPSGVLLSAQRHVFQAVAFDVNGRKEWRSLDYTITSDLDAVKALTPGDISVVSVDAAEAKWVVAFTNDSAPVRYWLWDRKAKAGTFLFSSQPSLDAARLATTSYVSIPSRDGLVLPAYLTLPPGAAPQSLPLVVLVHGGPWWRDSWGFRGDVQLLANRGYAVLQVNFRGSTGYGKRFLNAGNRQWGQAMQNDLDDAVRWAVGQSLAAPSRVAIMGTSYGGYATLAGLAFTPDTFACGVDLAGPSNLFTLLGSIPPYWQTMRATLLRRMGDPNASADKELLTRVSPLFSAQNIRAPLLLAQGANDPRVKVAEADQMFTALEGKGLRATYVLYPDEGHGLVRPANRLDFYARAEAFLATCLGGRAEPLSTGNGSAPTVRTSPSGKSTSRE
ncbi:MAG: S9 family peptidase, partial [Archangium sp.]|nr:S9 family peptidase [Archangium sp.]